MGYFYLSIAIIAEVVATSSLKPSQEFTKLLPSFLVISGYGLAFYMLSMVLRTIPVGVAYAIWAGVGIALISLVGVVLFQQRLDLPAILGIGLIISGVVVIHVFSKVTVL